MAASGMGAAYSPEGPKPPNGGVGEGRTGLAVGLGIALLAFLVAVGLLAFGGVRTGADTARYVTGAERLLAGDSLGGKQTSYLGYLGVVAVFLWTRLGLTALVVFQAAVAGAAAGAVYGLGRRLGGTAAGVVAGLAFAVNVDLAVWHTYVLTDSLFISAVALTAWLAVRADEDGGWWHAAAGAGLVFAALLRPNGWLLVVVALVALALRRLRAGWRIAAVVGVLATFGVLFTLVPAFESGVENESPAAMLEKGEVIWRQEELRHDMPDAPGGLETTGDALAYAVRHPAPTARLALARVTASVLHTRPYYSAKHNLLVAATLWPALALAGAGVVLSRREPVARYLAGVVAAQLLLVAATFADHDGRFLLYVLPLVLVFTGVSVARLWGRVSGRTGSRSGDGPDGVSSPADEPAGGGRGR